MARPDAVIAERKSYANDEQDYADRAAEADAHARNSVAVEVRHHRLRAVRRAASGHWHDQVEELDGPQHREKHREQDRWTEQRQRYPPEYLPAGGAVDMGGLVEVLVDLLQPGDVDHHVEAEVLPHDHHQYGVHGEIAIRENMRRRKSKAGRKPRNQSVFAVVNETPDQPGGNFGEDVGNE